MKRIKINEKYCMACRLCEINCIVAHSKSKKILKAFKEELPRALARVKVFEKGAVSFALQCRHCDQDKKTGREAPCIEACLTGAMKRNEKTGEVEHNSDKCIGCWMCIMSCPYGVIIADKRERKVATKCDLCPDEEVPACVQACINEALTLEEDE
ncbi:MAG: 4Fe-4S dicluster domain-containing protein [Elusimicrobiota bacterium]